MTTTELIVEIGEKNLRIDQFCAVRLKDFTRSQIQRLCDQQRILVNGAPVLKSYKVRVGDLVKVPTIGEISLAPAPENIPLKILYEDKDLAVVEKPKGLLVHPTMHEQQGSLAAALLFHYGEDGLSTLGGVERPGIVHRVDRDTSGMLLVAKNNEIHQKLSKALEKRQVFRGYQAVVYGDVKSDFGEISTPIGRDPVWRTRMAVVKDGRDALSYYRVKAHYPHFTWLDLELVTGRTHQLRVHLASMGHPVAGDVVYGPAKPITQLKGQCLHAYKLEFTHPTTGEHLSFESPLPLYFTDFLKKIDR